MSDVSAAFAFLHTKTLESFGTTSRMWYPAARKGTAYTVEIHAAAGPVSGKASALMGALTIPIDSITLHATAADFPFEPRPEDVFKFGATANTGIKYKVISAEIMGGIHSHYQIIAERHQ